MLEISITGELRDILSLYLSSKDSGAQLMPLLRVVFR